MSKLPRVLLLGDSIRMSYQPHVAMMLNGEAEVIGPSDNGQYSLYTLASLERWLHELGRPDVIHWNNGLHDCAHVPDRLPRQIPLQVYRLILDFIVQRLLLTGAHVISASSTPVHPDRPFRHDETSWRNEEIQAYNAMAADLMGHHDVSVNDLHSVIAADPGRFLDEDQVHLNKDGQQACARAVVAAVRPYFGKRR